MISALFNQPNYLAVKKMLEATVQRHEAIASNLANVETPNYKRIDLPQSFLAELQRAIGTKSADEINALQPRLAVDTTAKATKADGNTVQLESELAALNQNSIAHALETQLVTGQLLKLRLAITGRPF
jgi:flagellar basal-body rod protein FlgB